MVPYCWFLTLTSVTTSLHRAPKSAALLLNMPMPRRLNYVIEDKAANFPFVMMRNDLVVMQPKAPLASAAGAAGSALFAHDIQTFQSLSTALGAMNLQGSECAEEQALAVLMHPRWQEAVHEYMHLMSCMLPSCMPTPSDQSCLDEHSGATDAAQQPNDSRKHSHDERNLVLDEAVDTLIEVMQRRRVRAGQFYAAINEFVSEYNAMQQDLSAAEPLLKASHLTKKIAQMKETVERQYGGKVQELQRQCHNKRRRANLPKASVEVLAEWFAANKDGTRGPYPTEEEKRGLAAKANLREEQVSNWFVNVRKRYYRPSKTHK